MAQKLSVQIALEGGKEVERQLADIGEEGQKAFQKIQQSAEVAGGFKNLKISDVTAELQNMGTVGAASIDKINQAVKTAGRFENITSGLVSLEQGFDRAKEGANRATAAFGLTRRELSALRTAARQVDLGPLGSQLQAFGRVAAAFGPIGLAITAIGAAAAGATAAVIGFASAIGKVSDAAVKLGIPLEKFKEIQSGLEKSGVSGDAAAEGMAHFQKVLQQMIDQAPPDSQLKLFGDAAKMLEPELAKLEARLRSMPDGFARTNLAISQLGEKAGTEFIQGLRRAEGSMTTAEAKAYDLNQAMKTLDGTLEKVGTSVFSSANTGWIDPMTGMRTVSAEAGQTIQQLGQDAVEAGNKGAQGFRPWADVYAQLVRDAQNVGGAAQQAGQQGAQAGQQGAQGMNAFAQAMSAINPLWNAFAESAGRFGEAAVTSFNQVVGAIQGAGSALADFVSKITGVTWDTISSGATTAWNAVTTAIGNAGTAISDFVSKLGSITWDAISSAGVAAFDALIGAIQNTINKLLEMIGLKQRAAGSGGSAPGKARGGLIGGVGSGTSDSNLAWLSRGEHVMPAHVVRQPGVLSFLEAMRRDGGIPGYQKGGPVGGGGSPLVQEIITILQTLSNTNNTIINAIKQFGDSVITSMFQRIKETVDRLGSSVSDMIGQFEEGIAKLVDSVSQTMFGAIGSIAQTLASADNRIAGRARGGLFGGRGTGTSDSNLAWVSRGEYITPARAVAQPGVLAFLEALRRSGGNLSAVLDGMGRFALGGLVPRGAAGSMSHVTINFPGAPPVSGLRASSAVVEQLQKAAALAQVRSGGRKPSRYS